MKKISIFLIVIIALFVAIAVITKVQQNQRAEGNKYEKNDLHPETINQLNDPLYQDIILPAELQKKLKNGEDATVYFFSPVCSFCIETTPILMPVVEDMNIDLVQYNLLEFRQGFNEYEIEFTPTLIHFKAGKEQARLVGKHTKEEFEEFFNEYVK